MIRLSFALLLFVMLLSAACQPIVVPVAVPATEEADMPLIGEPEIERPDAPTYGVRGPYAVGTRDVIVNPDSERPLATTVWYPAILEEGVQELNIYNESYVPVFQEYPVVGRAIGDAEFDLSGGPYPLVVFSTGFMSSRLVAVNFTEHLASYGFVVMAPDHPGTLPVDLAGDLQYWAMFVDRPNDVKSIIAYAGEESAENGLFAGLVDVEKIAVTGVSSGGIGTWAAGGAQYDFAMCTESPERGAEYTSAYGDDCNQIIEYYADLASIAGLDAAPEGLWPPLFDEAVDAIIPIVPDFGLYGFENQGIESVEVPTLILVGGADSLGRSDLGGIAQYERVSSEHKALVNLEQADHVFLVNACRANPWMTTDIGWGHWFCSDPVWDMQRAHDISNHFVAAFLLAELYGDTDAAAALAPENVDFRGVLYTAEGYSAQ